jgi:glycosyltransferase involved in cell wall biosynthesis
MKPSADSKLTNAPLYGLRGEAIVCFAGEDWWYHHPHSKNHILKRLAKENRVLFVNSITMGLPSMSNPDFLLKIRRKLGSLVRWLRKVPEGLYVFTPISLPFYGTRALRALNQILLILQLRLVMLLCNLRKPIVWAAIPSAVDVVEHLGAKMVVYQVSDKYDANEDSALSQNIIRDMDRRLKECATVVMYSGRKLYEESDVPHRYFLEQAVDFEHFAKAIPEADEVKDIPRPVLGYFGFMDYVMDVPLIEEVARLRPEWHWLFIGRKSNLVQISAANCHFVGSVPYADLPSFLRHIDVCVLPWRKGHTFTSYGSAIKVREYLASGKPVVISPLYEYQSTPGIRTYETTQEFVAAIEDALHNDTQEDKQLRQGVVRKCTWDTRAGEVGAMFCTLLQTPIAKYSPDPEITGPAGKIGRLASFPHI